MKKKLNLVFLFTLGFSCFLFTQNKISGVVNEYTSVLNFSGCDSSTLIVSSSLGFSNGDEVLIIQMKGTEVNLSNSHEFGDITKIGNAGNYEINRIKDISGNEIRLQFKVTRQYDIEGAVQLVRIPEFEDAVVIGTLTCKPWNGLTGGILALDVKNLLTLQSNINVSEMGFRGGVLKNENTLITKEIDYYYSSPVFAGAKGESIAEIPINQLYGRGKAANGGGGGNAHNAGGGGGGNAGKGGNGGLEYYNTPFSPTVGTNGIGGLPIFKSNKQKIILGGGGGAGHSNDNRGTSGGTGGGIAIIRSRSIESNGFKIYSNGGNVFSPGTDRNDGQGGGGAGGAIIIQSEEVIGTLECDLKGGQGGSCLFYIQSQIIGPGGGGSGGKLLLSQNLPNITANLTGGVNGIANQNQTNEAEIGEIGSILLDIVLS